MRLRPESRHRWIGPLALAAALAQLASGAGCTGSVGTEGTGGNNGKITDLPGADGGADAQGADGGGGDARPAAPLLLTITLHLENQTVDAAYFAALDDFAARFEAHGGKLTLEPRQTTIMMSDGLFDWRTMEARGHAVGSHAAIGGTTPTTLLDFTTAAKARYDQLAPKVDHLTHISGNCGDVDWVKGVIDAGFTATTATTVLCLYSMAAADRPDPYKTLDCTGATDPTCHTSYPSAFAQRVHPWRASSGANWLVDDPSGGLVIFPGSGSLPCLEEEATSPGATLPTCTLTVGDVTRALYDLDAASQFVDPDRVNTYYWVWGSWSISDAEKPVLEAFLAAIDDRVARGEVQWANVLEMEDAYHAWEATHR